MAMFSFKRGSIDKWYQKEMKNLNDTYFSSLSSTGGGSGAQAANNKSTELEKSMTDLKAEYLKRLEAIGQKPRSDFSNS